MRGPIDLRFVMNVNWTSNFQLILITYNYLVTMVTKAYKMMMAAILDKFSIFEILSKIERYYKNWIGNTVLCDKNAKY